MCLIVIIIILLVNIDINYFYLQLSGSKGKGSKSKLQLHGSSNYYLVCLAKWSSFKQTKKSCSVHTSLETANREQISINREYLKIFIDIVLYLSKQGLAFRGHDEKELSTNQGIHK